MTKSGFNVSLKGADDIFLPRNPGRSSGGNRYSRFPLRNCTRSQTTHSKYWMMSPCNAP